MSAVGTMPVASPVALSDSKLIDAVRDGDDAAFEELYRRYRPRICAFVRRMTRDEGRAEDVAQEVFLSALRRLRATDSDIAFKPWIYEIARNATIDVHRRASRAEEISIDEEEALPSSDRRRLLGFAEVDSTVVARERVEHLRSAFDELSETHHRALVMREFEGRSYREIGERLDLTRPAVESVLFRARRRLEREYEELDSGRRCQSMRTVMARLAEGIDSEAGAVRLRRHARRCGACRRQARLLGVEPLALPRLQVGRDRVAAAGRRAAALLPLPAFLRRTGVAGSGGGEGSLGAFVASGAPPGVWEKAVALVTALGVAGAGGAVIGGEQRVPAEPAAAVAGQPYAPARGERVFNKGYPPGVTSRSTAARDRSSSRGQRKRPPGKGLQPGGSGGNGSGHQQSEGQGVPGGGPVTTPPAAVPEVPPAEAPQVDSTGGPGGSAGAPGPHLPDVPAAANPRALGVPVGGEVALPGAPKPPGP